MPKLYIDDDDSFYNWLKENYPDIPHFNDWYNELVEEDGEELQEYLREYYYG